MELITTVGAWALGSVSSYTAGLCLGFLPAFTSNIFSPVDSSLASDLGPRLSQNAAILLPGSADSTIATDRWQQYVVPNITVVVEVATESDIQQTVSQVPSQAIWTSKY